MRRPLVLAAIVALAFTLAGFSPRAGTKCPGPNPHCQPAPTGTPTPTVLPSPTSAPTVLPSPTPVPSSPARPFPPPGTTQTISVPTTVTDINAFLATVPDGSTLEFPSTGSYGAVLIRNRTNLILHGNGATIRQTGVGSDQFSTAFLVQQSTHIAIEDWQIVGNNPNTTNIFVPGSENSHAFATGGWGGYGPSSYIEIGGVGAQHEYGDFAYLEGQNIGPNTPSDHIWIHDVGATWIGRNGVSGINATDVLIERSSFDRIGMDALDIEPNFAAEQVRRWTFRQNTVGSYGNMSQYQGWLLNTWSVNFSPVSEITIDGNTVTGNPAGRFDGSPRALNTNVSHSTLSTIAFTNNHTTLAARGTVLIFDGVSGVTVTGNVQPLVSGVLASFTNCTGVVYSGNS